MEQGAMVENSKAEQNETSMDSKVTGAGMNKLNKASDVIAEKDSLDFELSSGKEDSEDKSNDGMFQPNNIFLKYNFYVSSISFKKSIFKFKI